MHSLFKKAALVVAVAATTLTVSAYDRITGHHFASRSEVMAPEAMAATSQGLATQVALDVMKAGGNAIDAAIAANAMLGLVEPTGNGIGGDLYAIIWHAESQQLYGLNASGRSPMSLSLDYFLENGYESIPQRGLLPLSVPGAVDGWFEMHERFGNMPMSDILAPSIHYAENGFPVTEVIAYYFERNAEVLQDFPGFRDVFMKAGRTPQKGEMFRNPDLANTYAQIAEGGRDVFYRGAIARTIGDFVQEHGGFLSYDDMAAHESEWVQPVSTNYRGYDLWELPPNTQGIAALQILNILEQFDIAAMGFDSPEYIHHFVEAKKLAFEDRAKFYSDMQFNEIPVDWLISKEYAQERAKLINSERAGRSYEPGNPPMTGDTIYLTTADKHGNMVSLIQSNYRGMGSGITPSGLGFVLQNRGELFALDPNHMNVFEPGKRPFNTIIPAFVTKDGKPVMSYGVMGGGTQPQMHAQILINMLDFGMNLQEAGDAPRILHTGSSQPTGETMTDGGVLSLENGFSDNTRRELIKMGHRLQEAVGPYGGYQAIWYDAEQGIYIGASESRKDGYAAGY
ncbi:gamma-glutamyltransferase [Aliidiomarina halalkaliphila]|uniref:Glutathione hydrolase proenzyme n=1 Tax=Aliidiomarina halalkaliphila TaxID=2593535 RepID=A0A552X5Z1_9GAMM|nr:gamma-glutamyltransferase [Aliidiomarina halalkaliphila]TRW50369.1 gamma-glutamyltransferase [Aliidiomarina halalkaliphila]